jgi:hypothetical protein
MNPLVERARRFLLGRRRSYLRVFSQDNLDAKTVLADLAAFCRAHDSTGHPNPTVAARLDGRREVFLRIQHHLRLTDDAMWTLYGTGQRPTKGEE